MNSLGYLSWGHLGSDLQVGRGRLSERDVFDKSP
jgi:hypothetical protein